MNKDVILIAKSNYEKKTKEKEKLIELREELEALKENEHVKRYLALASLEWKKPADDQFLIKNSFSGLKVLDDRDPKIYLFMGAYNRNYEYSSNDFLAAEKYSADYWLYKNLLDENDIVKVKPEMTYSFESDNIILKTRSSVITNAKYLELQNIFFEELIKTDSDSLEFSNVLEKVKANL